MKYYPPLTWQWAMDGARATAHHIGVRQRVYGWKADNGRWYYRTQKLSVGL